MATNLLSVSVDLLILGLSYKWSLIIRDLLCLALTQHRVVEVHPCCSVLAALCSFLRPSNVPLGGLSHVVDPVISGWAFVVYSPFSDCD